MKFTKAFLIVLAAVSLAGQGAAIDFNSSTALNYYNDGTLEFQTTGTGQINTQGSLNMNGNTIINHYSAQCSGGSAVVDIENDGTIECTDVTGEVQGDFVSRSGDTMNGKLNMQGNFIENIGSGNIRIGDGAGDINMNGNRIYGGSLSQFSEGGISSSLSDTQNNLDTLSANSFYVAGDVKVGGDFVGTGGDLAENVKTRDERLEAGTVATITGKFEVAASNSSYDTAAAGVVSTDPGVRLAEERDGVPLALSGIVPVKTTVSNGDISPGDLLTTSDREGYAMKCKDASRCDGAIIGKSMESLDETGKVQAVVTLG